MEETFEQQIHDLASAVGAKCKVLNTKIGSLASLSTVDKSSIVAAINELDSRVGELDDLNTDNKDNVVSAINEVIKESPFVYEDVNNPESGVVLKD